MQETSPFSKKLKLYPNYQFCKQHTSIYNTQAHTPMAAIPVIDLTVEEGSNVYTAIDLTVEEGSNVYTAIDVADSDDEEVVQDQDEVVVQEGRLHKRQRLTKKPASQDTVYVKQSTIKGAGKGLFTNQFMSKGTTVVAMCDPVLLSYDVWKEYEENNPDDWAVYVSRLRKYVWDRHQGAVWKKINHLKRRPNLKMTFTTDNNQVKAEWVALRDIQQGEELLWDYGVSLPRKA
jgi:hypothetical protein